jgi:hypothetical protein
MESVALEASSATNRGDPPLMNSGNPGSDAWIGSGVEEQYQLWQFLSPIGREVGMNIFYIIGVVVVVVAVLGFFGLR